MAMSHVVPQQQRWESQPTKKQQVVEELKQLVADLTGVFPNDETCNATFVELGVDSLLLIQLARTITERVDVPIKFQDLLVEYPSLDSLANHLSMHPAYRPQVASMDGASTIQSAPLPQPAKNGETSLLDPEARERPLAPRRSDTVAGVIAQQLEAFTELTRLQLRYAAPGRFNPSVPVLPPTVPPKSQTTTERTVNESDAIREPFAEHRRVAADRSKAELDSAQQIYLTRFIERYVEKTKRSKAHVGRHRPYLADGRSSVSFRRPLKEMLYPLVNKRSLGSRVWDLDGNEYIDLTMGFGVHLFGHSPAFVMDAIRAELENGIAIGFQSELAGKVAKQLCGLTKQDRAVFANSGTEAVMAALRVARANTGREQIALFRGSYHGWSDLTLAKRIGSQDELRSIPLALGVTKGASNDVMVLEYNATTSLEILRKRGSNLAAILVEPVQSRNPLIQPKEFLSSLRQIADETGALLIFDETVTGFRVHPQGAQGILGVQPDLSIYGKSVGGGMPLGVLAGRSTFMDVLDGGPWDYGDDSYPSREKTFFAGTFCKHPLALAAAEAVLTKLSTAGPSLQENLTGLTTEFVSMLNRVIQEHRVPISIEQFGSFFHLVIPTELYAKELLLYHLIHNGVYVWEGRSCFLSTAHTREDLDQAAAAFQSALTDLRHAKLFPAATSASSNSNNQPLQVPLTTSQLNIVLATQMDADAAITYNESLILSLEGPVDASSFRAALAMLIERHDSLRAVLAVDKESLLIQPTIDLELRQIDLTTMPTEERASESAELGRKEVVRPFDLHTGPLFRILLIRLSLDCYEMVFTSHHLITDGWSMSILLRELRTIYAALRQNENVQLPRARQFHEYIELRRTRLANSDSAQAFQYWKDRFATPVPQLELPLARKRLATKSNEGFRVSLTLPPALVDDIRTCAIQNSSTLSMVLLSVYISFLHRWTGQYDIVVGLPSAGQATTFDSVVGCCLDVLPIRSRTDFVSTLPQVLSRVRADVSSAQQYAEYLASRETTANTDQSVPSKVTISTMFNLDESHGPSVFHDLTVSARPNWNGTCKFDLELNGTLRGNSLTLDMYGRSTLMSAEHLEKALEKYQVLLQAWLNNPQLELHELPILSSSECDGLIRWNSTHTELPEITIHEGFALQVRKRGDQIAVSDHDRNVSYRMLDDFSDDVARALVDRGIRKENIVAVQAERGLEFVIALLAILKAGAAYLPMDSRLPEVRRQQILADANVSAVLSVNKNSLLFNQDECPIWSYSTPAPQQREHFSIDSRTLPDNLAYVNYTSGSTGTPKGVAITHAGVIRLVLGANYLHCEPEDVLANIHNVTFDATTFDIWAPLLNGARIVIVSREELLDIPTFARLIVDANVTILSLTSAVFSQLMLEAPAVLSGLRQLIVGGDVVDPGAVRKMLQVGPPTHFMSMYGPTECTTFAIFYRILKMREDTDTVPIGTPISNTSAYVVTPQTTIVPVGARGELWIGGEGLARCYLGRPDLTAEKFVPDPFSGASGARLYRTGDLCRSLSDGVLEFHGRIDRQVKIRGFRVEPRETEVALARCEGVEQAIVEIDYSNEGKPRMIAYLVPTVQPKKLNGGTGLNNAPAGVTEERNQLLHTRLRHQLGETLPDYMIPSLFVVVDTFPLTANGKIDRSQLPKPGTDNENGKARLPGSSIESVLFGIWSSVLKRTDFGVDDDLFELGGDSLVAMRIAGRIREHMASELQLSALFEYRSVASLSRYLELLPNNVTSVNA